MTSVAGKLLVVLLVVDEIAHEPHDDAPHLDDSLRQHDIRRHGMRLGTETGGQWP